MLELKNIRKNLWRRCRIERRQPLSVAAGEVHLLRSARTVPAKSTLMKILAGMVERDGGEMLWRRSTRKRAFNSGRRPPLSALPWCIRSPYSHRI